MTIRYIKNNNGKFNGSIGDGRDDVPTITHISVTHPDSSEVKGDMANARHLLNKVLANSLYCDRCEKRIYNLTQPEVERVSQGFVFKCKNCIHAASCGNLRELTYDNVLCEDCGEVVVNVSIGDDLEKFANWCANKDVEVIGWEDFFNKLTFKQRCILRGLLLSQRSEERYPFMLIHMDHLDYLDRRHQ